MNESELKRIMEEFVPFNRHLGVQLITFGHGRVVIRLPFNEAWIGDPRRPALHGGVISTMIDTAGGAAAFTTLDATDRLSTVDMRVDFLRPGEPRDLNVAARILRGGNRVILTMMQAYHDDAGDPIAEGRAVYNLRRTSGDTVGPESKWG